MKKIIKIAGKKITIIHKKTTVSTNTDALKLPENTLVLADIQTGGKGRMGRTFISPKGGIYMSLSVNPEISVSFLTTAAAVAATYALEEMHCKDIKIKWVNDLFLNEKKICGILASAAADSGNTNAAVLGIGVNLVQKVGFTEELANTAGYVYKKGPFGILRKRFIYLFLNKFLSLIESNNTEEIFNVYSSKDYLKGKTVTFIKGTKEFKGRAIGFDKKINLLVDVHGTVHTLSFGEVTLSEY